MTRPFVFCFVCGLFLIGLGCGSDPSTCTAEGPLPVLGQAKIEGKDTIPHQIPAFLLLNQDSQAVTNATLDDRIYVADFFFTSCPTICPKVKRQMLRIYEKYEDDPRVALLSFTIDPKRDTVGKLRDYAQNLDVASDKWYFLTGEKDEIYELADDYFSIVIEDETVPGGFDHSGRLILVDPQGRIRSFASDGTTAADTDKLMCDMDVLLQELRPSNS